MEYPRKEDVAHGCEYEDRCVTDLACPFYAECRRIEGIPVEWVPPVSGYSDGEWQVIWQVIDLDTGHDLSNPHRQPLDDLPHQLKPRRRPAR
jgi:hypothetical protein